ncbi:MAG TPA: DUF3151 domain-containing protein [Actinomycetales bacterium]|nr:DUF3151 domain-containing protein [Actinomycetales bacterium]
MSNPGGNLLGGIEPTLLPADHPDTTVAARLAAGEAVVTLAAELPSSSLAWAVLADDAFERGADVESYAYARVGYHRGLDALRRAGWRGQGPVPFSHAPNQGFLRALAALGRAAEAISEDDEATRCRDLLADCDPQAAAQLG